ncbi:MAG: alpha-L-fucosidase [Firmicutes bacterium]|nr:alpha-L-fucosidase [Bacillota bacterium]
MIYENNWASLNSRPVPEWFGDAKFGIFIHWGLYSVPAYARRGEYAEWYGSFMGNDDHPAKEFHERTYGKNFRYADFVSLFRAELFDADEWAELMRDSGAKYMNFVSKHHDGFCMYKTELAPYWNSSDVGPHRDFCAELKEACGKAGVRFGVYHSVYEWWHPECNRNPEKYALTHLIPMLKELVEKYQPYTLFTDGEWSHPSSVWHSTDFLTWLYNESSVRDIIVPNDRWGNDTRGIMGGNFTTEYGDVGFGRTIDKDNPRPFEECRGIGRSFGFNRMEQPSDYMSVKDLLVLLCSLVSAGGNLLLNIGPDADGTIPAIMKERLLGMGKWLSVNGEAIYGSKPYTREKTDKVWYTVQPDALYAIIPDYPCGVHVFDRIPFEDGMKVEVLGANKGVRAFCSDGKLGVDMPFAAPSEVGDGPLYTFKITK